MRGGALEISVRLNEDVAKGGTYRQTFSLTEQNFRNRREGGSCSNRLNRIFVIDHVQERLLYNDIAHATVLQGAKLENKVSVQVLTRPERVLDAGIGPLFLDHSSNAFEIVVVSLVVFRVRRIERHRLAFYSGVVDRLGWNVTDT